MLSIDGKANDGAADEGDNVLEDVEDIISGAGNDLIAGSDSDNRIWGGAGNDTIHGGGGDDTLYDGPTLCAGGDRRRRTCPAGEILFADQLFGDAGSDALFAMRGADSLFGGDGNDVLYATPTPGGGGFQTLDGGGGNDDPHIDAAVDIVSNVEKVFDANGQQIP